MEDFTIKDVRELAEKQAAQAMEYCKARKEAGKAKVALDLSLTAELVHIRS